MHPLGAADVNIAMWTTGIDVKTVVRFPVRNRCFKFQFIAHLLHRSQKRFAVCGNIERSAGSVEQIEENRVNRIGSHFDGLNDDKWTTGSESMPVAGK